MSVPWQWGPPITRYPSRLILSTRMHFISTEYCKSSNSGYSYIKNDNHIQNYSYHHLNCFYQDTNQQWITNRSNYNNNIAVSLLNPYFYLSGLLTSSFNSLFSSAFVFYLHQTFFQEKQLQTFLSFFQLRVLSSLTEIIAYCLTSSVSVQPASALLYSPDLNLLSSSFLLLLRLLLSCRLRPTHNTTAGFPPTRPPLRPLTLPFKLRTFQTVSFFSRTPLTTNSQILWTLVFFRVEVISASSARNSTSSIPSHLFSHQSLTLLPLRLTQKLKLLKT